MCIRGAPLVGAVSREATRPRRELGKCRPFGSASTTTSPQGWTARSVRRRPGRRCRASGRRSRGPALGGGRRARPRRWASRDCPPRPKRRSRTDGRAGDGVVGDRAAAHHFAALERERSPERPRLAWRRARRPPQSCVSTRREASARSSGSRAGSLPRSGPASSSSTLRAASSLHRLASTHPAAPPPTITTSKTLMVPCGFRTFWPVPFPKSCWANGEHAPAPGRLAR